MNFNQAEVRNDHSHGSEPNCECGTLFDLEESQEPCVEADFKNESFEVEEESLNASFFEFSQNEESHSFKILREMETNPGEFFLFSAPQELERKAEKGEVQLSEN